MQVDISQGPNNYWLCQVITAPSQNQQSLPIKLWFVIDNSGSMGPWTRRVTTAIGKGVWSALEANKCNLLPAHLNLFDTQSTVLSLRSQADFDKIVYPRQGSTDITLAIKTTMSQLLHQAETNVHHILVFLSDGEHNSGSPKFDAVMAQVEHAAVVKAELKLSTIIVGIEKSDTQLGTTIKSMETVPLHTIDPVYFADRESQISPLLEKMVFALNQSLLGGETLDLSLGAGDAVFVSGNQTTRHNSLFVFNHRAEFVIRSSQQPILLDLNGQPLALNKVEFEPNHVSKIIDLMSAKLSQQRVVGGLDSILASLSDLEKMIQLARDAFALASAQQNPQNNFEQECKNGHLRRAMLKSARTRLVNFETERNRLLALKNNIQNDSSSLAGFLNGMQTGKYASKAVSQAGTVGQTPSQVLDTLAQLWRSAPPAPEPKDNTAVSMISLNSTAEHLEEWRQLLLEDDGAQWNDIYSILVAFGMVGYSVKFLHSSAAQMDPYQTRCLALEPFCVADTSSVLLAQQCERKIKSPSGKNVTDCLLLVDPSCPELCLAAMKTPIYQYLCSITLCRDLYMYHPNMTGAMLSNALLRCFQDWTLTRSESFRSEYCIQFALKIVYSINKSHPISKNSTELFNHWFNEWDSITQSERDGCASPVQLLLLLAQMACTDVELSIEQSVVPLLNLCNEALSRYFKEQLYIQADAKQPNSRHLAKKIALSAMQKLFGITPENSPQPIEDVMTEEPPLEAIRTTCQPWSTISTDYEQRFMSDFGIEPGIGRIVQFVDDFCKPWIAAFNFGLALRQACTKKSWDAWSTQMEELGDVPRELLSKMVVELEFRPLDMCQVFGLGSKKSVCEAMLLQACLNYDSASRSGIVNLTDLRDGQNLRNMIVDLRMGHYLEKLSSKKKLWLDMIGDATLAQALAANSEEYAQMIGRHTHGGCKDRFWALWKAAVNDQEKRKTFLARTNDCFLGAHAN